MQETYLMYLGSSESIIYAPCSDRDRLERVLVLGFEGEYQNLICDWICRIDLP